MQLCSPTARTLGSLLTNDVWWGQYGKPFEQALQKLYSKNRSRVGWKREWERVIVCPWLKSGVGFMASSPSFLFGSVFLHSSFFFLPPLLSLYLSLPIFSFLLTFPPCLCPSFPFSLPFLPSLSLVSLPQSTFFSLLPTSWLPFHHCFICCFLFLIFSASVLSSMSTWCTRNDWLRTSWDDQVKLQKNWIKTNYTVLPTCRFKQMDVWIYSYFKTVIMDLTRTEMVEWIENNPKLAVFSYMGW